MARASLFQKDLPEEERIFYYESEESDPIQTKEQERGDEARLPEGYEFIPRNVLKRIWAWMVYAGFYLFGHWYELWYWRVKVHGREKLKAARGKGYVLYATHTNPFHDVFGPGVVARNRRVHTIISPVNLKLPGIGWLLPALGGLPLGKTAEEKQKFNEAVDKRLAQKRVVTVYPEAHVWPYYTGVRKFPAGSRSFKYAARNGLPVYTMTTTYHRRKGVRKGGKQGKHWEMAWAIGRERELPRMEVYVDGPFYPKAGLSVEENCDLLAKQAYEAMKAAAKHSTYEYFKYVKKSGAKDGADEKGAKTRKGAKR